MAIELSIQTLNMAEREIRYLKTIVSSGMPILPSDLERCANLARVRDSAANAPG